MTTFAQVEDALKKIETSAGVTTTRGWSPSRALVHCAQSIEFSVTGFPKPRSWLFTHTVGPIAARRFLGRGSLSHDLTAPIPGAPEIDEQGELGAGVARLRAAMAAFREHRADLKPHFAFGRLAPDAYEALHTMHFADHATAFAIA